MSDFNNKTADIFLFMGQSNMAGRGVSCAAWPEGAPAPVAGAGYEFRAVSDPSRLYPLAEPFGVMENKAGGIDDGRKKTGSMVTAFVNAYYEKTDVPVVGVSASKGGSSLAEWQPGGLYLTDTLERYAACLDFLKLNGFTVRHSYVLWCQGETDGDLGTGEQEFKSMFRALLTTLTGAGIEKLFMVSIGQCNIPGSYDRYSPVIRWLEELALEEDDVIPVSRAFAGMRERGLMKDEYHYYQAGYNECGTEAGTNAAAFVSSGSPHSN